MRFIKEESGQVIVGFALILPVFVFVALAVLDIQWMTKQSANVSYIATEVARCEALRETSPPAPLPCSPATGGVSPYQYAMQLARSLGVTSDGLTVKAPDCDLEKGICTVDVSLSYKPIGVWFPALTIKRTGAGYFPPTSF